MKSFRNYINESTINSAPSVPEDKRLNTPDTWSQYTKDPDEVYLKKLGLKSVKDHHLSRKDGWKKGSVEQHNVNIKDIHFEQNTVNRGKVKEFIKHDFSVESIPKLHAYKMPDGNWHYEAQDGTHRLASMHTKGIKNGTFKVQTWKRGEVVER